MKFDQSSPTSDSEMESTNSMMRSRLFRSEGLESMAFWMVTRASISLSEPLPRASRHFCTKSRM